MNFQELVAQTLNEMNVAGGAGSVFVSSPAPAPAQGFSGDTYAPGDARTPKSLYGGVMTRKGLKKKKKKK
jgi:hypothetical protein